MILQLRSLFIGEKDVFKFDETLVFKENGFENEIVSHVSGKIVSKNNIVSLYAKIKYVLNESCDRCLEQAEIVREISVRHIIEGVASNRATSKKDVSEFVEPKRDSDYLALDDQFAFDLKNLVWEEINLDFDIKCLCSEDCKGICQKCGCNLNKMTCNCAVDSALENDENDHPFGKLKTLLNDL